MVHLWVWTFQMDRSYLESLKVTSLDAPGERLTALKPLSRYGGEPAEAGGDT